MSARPPTRVQASTSLRLGPEVTRLPTRLNCTPQPHEARQFFYHDAAFAVRRALTAGHSRVTLRCTVPETNPEMDVFRIGTLLEMVRELAVQLVEDGKRPRICVQGALGQGVFQGLPLTLSGARARARAPRGCCHGAMHGAC
jgi:adenylate kinase